VTEVNAEFTLPRVHELIGLGPSLVRALVARGFVVPSRGARNELRFTFQDLLLLKTAAGLRRAKVPTKRIMASLATLRDSLPADLPLTGLRITAAGAEVAVRDAGGVREASTGQLVLDFEVQVSPYADVRVADRLHDQTPQGDAYSLGEALEATDPAGAEAAYRAAIRDAPDHVDAIVNLGALLCDAGRCHEAVELFDSAIARGAQNGLLHFNRGVALEDVGQVKQAVAAYRAALEADPGLVDAHYNLGVLLDDAGDGQGALRHFSAYRRLTAKA
jgi:tetratricopeptide (TPR) repeat protein